VEIPLVIGERQIRTGRMAQAVLPHDHRYVLADGTYDDSVGWFVRPTLIEAIDPGGHTMSHELFGPILTLHVYDESKWKEMLDVVDSTSPCARTGAVFSQDRYALQAMLHHLRHAAGSFCVDDTPTGVVVGQQPFGGARMSGTNDKAGPSLNLPGGSAPARSRRRSSPPRTTGTPSWAEGPGPGPSRRPGPGRRGSLQDGLPFVPTSPEGGRRPGRGRSPASRRSSRN
jgi:hypothetical protein